MSKPPQDTSGLGYAYHLPSGGLLLRIRNSLSQFSDLFSEFNKYIAPAYHHDRCERSVHMRLYSMNKREFVLSFLALFACFGLGIFIGLAGPPITVTTEISSTTLLANTSYSGDKNFMATGPFVIRSPLMTTYSQQLWLIAQMETDNSDDERFDKSFQVSVAIDGVTDTHKPVTVLPPGSAKNRFDDPLLPKFFFIDFIFVSFFPGHDTSFVNETTVRNLQCCTQVSWIMRITL